MSQYQIKSLYAFIIVASVLFAAMIINFLHIVPAAVALPSSGLVIVGVMIFFWLRELENNRQKYEFITIVTHKFRTPLSGIRWAIQMLHNEITFQQKEDLLKEMEKANERLMEIVDLLVGAVKFDTRIDYAYEAVSLREMLDLSLQKYSEQIRAKNISFKIEARQSLPLIVIDKRKVQFVIDMLVDNAVKYTPSAGTVAIVCYEDKHNVLLKIQDSGIGIPSADIKRIFNRFFRTADAKKVDTEGMGLGLYTAKTIVEHHGGKIRVTSDGKGKGSTFYLQFPIKAR